MAGTLAEMSVHIRRSGLLLVAAGAFALLALTARGPLGVARVCGPRLHAGLDMAVALAVAVAPILPAIRPEPVGILVVEVVAVAWIRVATLTRYTRAPAGTATTAEVETAPGTPAAGGAEGRGDRPGSLHVHGAVLARGLGILAGRSAKRLPAADERLRSGARQAGRHAARLQRTWRKPPT